jgi:hypothetical protein
MHFVVAGLARDVTVSEWSVSMVLLQLLHVF